MTARAGDLGLSDGELVSVLHIDPSALELFYRRHVEAVTKHLARRCRDPHVVADVVSRTFMKALDKSSSWRPERSGGSAKGWLYRIASNQLADYFREQERLTKLGEKWKIEVQLSRFDIDRIDALISAEAAMVMRQHLDRLNEAERSAVVLVDIDGLSHAEAAFALGITRVTLRARLSRAHRHLRALIGEELSKETSND